MCIGSVEIPPSISVTADSAFLGAKITSMIMPDSVRVSDVNAFLGLTLTSINLSNSIIEKPKSTFEQSALHDS